VNRRAVFLDRDGVLNEPVVRDGKPYPPTSPEEVVVCDGAAQALFTLRELGFALVCVTNQPDVARGTVSNQTIESINAHLMSKLPLDAVFVCRHDDVDDCACRKPKPGLIFQAARELGLDPAASYLVGDRWRDVDAGAAANCRTVLVDRGYRERSSTIPPDARVTSISEAAAWIVSDQRIRSGSR
jgi:D-glycero-D-manno-heptose 1,7-bisphosphate phosphatase